MILFLIKFVGRLGRLGKFGKFGKLGNLGNEYIFFGFDVKIGFCGCSVVEVGNFVDLGLRILGEVGDI